MKSRKKLIFTEKLNNQVDKTKIIIRTEQEINEYNNKIGYRKARMKRYGKSASERLKNKTNFKSNI